MTLFNDPHFDWRKNDVGGFVPDIWFYNTPENSSQTHYWNDKLMAVLLGTIPKFYSDFMKYYGAIGPRNGQTYFKTQEDCETFLDILKYLYNEIIVNGRDWLSVSWEIINGTESMMNNDNTDNEDRENYYLGHIKTYRNLQSYQGTWLDLNTTKLDSKDMNTGHFTENPFKPGQSKKPSHYIFM